MRLIDQIIVPPAEGKAFIVKRGLLLRIALPDGPQVVDLNAFNVDDPREMFCSSVTALNEGAHLSTGGRMWSNPPYERPIMTVTADTVKLKPDPRGAVSHDVILGRCTRKRRLQNYGSDTPGCQELIASAIAAFGMGEESVHPAFNIFMKTGLGPDGKFFWVEPDAVAGDYLEVRAEIDCLVAISTCPGRSSGPKHHPVSFEIYHSTP
jgi:uncharacterized protein YcgI (DUF1989 family)